MLRLIIWVANKVLSLSVSVEIQNDFTSFSEIIQTVRQMQPAKLRDILNGKTDFNICYNKPVLLTRKQPLRPRPRQLKTPALKTKTKTKAPKHKRNVNIIESQIKAVMYHE